MTTSNISFDDSDEEKEEEEHGEEEEKREEEEEGEGEGEGGEEEDEEEKEEEEEEEEEDVIEEEPRVKQEVDVTPEEQVDAVSKDLTTITEMSFNPSSYSSRLSISSSEESDAKLDGSVIFNHPDQDKVIDSLMALMP